MEGNKSISFKVWISEVLSKIFTNSYYVGESRKLAQGAEENATMYQASEDDKDALTDYIRQGVSHITSVLSRMVGRTSESEETIPDTHDTDYWGEITQEVIYASVPEAKWGLAKEDIRIPGVLFRDEDGATTTDLTKKITAGKALVAAGKEKYTLIASSRKALEVQTDFTWYINCASSEKMFVLLRNDGDTTVTFHVSGTETIASVEHTIAPGAQKMITLTSTYEDGVEELEITAENTSNTGIAICSVLATTEQKLCGFYTANPNVEIPDITAGNSSSEANITLWKLFDAPTTPIVTFSMSATQNVPEEIFKEVASVSEDYIVAYALREWSMSIRPDEAATFANRMAELEARLRILASARSKPTRRAFHTMNPNEIIFE